MKFTVSGEYAENQCARRRITIGRQRTHVLSRHQIPVRVCVCTQKRDIDINRGQGQSGACFVIKRPLLSKVVNLLFFVDVALFQADPTFSAVLLPLTPLPSPFPLSNVRTNERTNERLLTSVSSPEPPARFACAKCQIMLIDSTTTS